MKRTQEILGLPIISISDGEEVGKVKGIIVNADKGAIDYVVVDSGIQILGARVIATENILGIGEYALTIENESIINDISKIPAAVELLKKDVQVKGTKVLTKMGRLIGEIGDIYVDNHECCKIRGLEFIADITQKRIRLIPRNSVITFGKNLIVVVDHVESTLVDKSSELMTDTTSVEEKKNTMNNETGDLANLVGDLTAPQEQVAATFIKEDTLLQTIESKTAFEVKQPIEEAEAHMGDNAIEEISSKEIPLEEICLEEVSFEKEIDYNEAVIAPEVEKVLEAEFTSDIEVMPEIHVQEEKQADSASDLFEQRQRQYLIGRKITKNITDNQGTVIANVGDVIDDEIISHCKSNGKLIELVMNNKN